MIADFAAMVADVVGYGGDIVFDASRPDGAPQKLLDVGRLAKLGWTARTELRAGIEMAYRDFLRRCADDNSVRDRAAAKLSPSAQATR
jgi:GDP-L-fucose synthase